MSQLKDYELTAECSNCRFWHTADVISTVIGQCRRHGPHCRPDNPERIWTQTTPQDWCGEFLSKPAPPGWNSYPTQAYVPPPFPGRANKLSAAKALFHKGP